MTPFLEMNVINALGELGELRDRVPGAWFELTKNGFGKCWRGNDDRNSYTF